MRICVIGTGGLGGYYGALLSLKSSAEIFMLARSDYEVIRSNGIRVLSPEGDFKAHINVSLDARDVAACDWIIVTAKSTANPALAETVQILCRDRSSKLLTLQNGLGNEEFFAGIIGAERTFGGICFIGSSRIAPGVIQHKAHKHIKFGSLLSENTPDLPELVSIFEEAGVPCEIIPSLAQGRWEKLFWNIPFNGLSTLFGLTTEEILKDETLRKRARTIMEEVIQASAALGTGARVEEAEKSWNNTPGLGAYRTSMLMDAEQGRELELKGIFEIPLNLASHCNVQMPETSRLFKGLMQKYSEHGNLP